MNSIYQLNQRGSKQRAAGAGSTPVRAASLLMASLSCQSILRGPSALNAFCCQGQTHTIKHKYLQKASPVKVVPTHTHTRKTHTHTHTHTNTHKTHRNGNQRCADTSSSLILTKRQIQFSVHLRAETHEQKMFHCSVSHSFMLIPKYM